MIRLACTMRRNVGEEIQHRVVVFLRDGINFMVVASSTPDGQAQKCLSGRPQYVVKIVVTCEFPVRGFIIPDAEAIIASRNHAIFSPIGQLVARDLLFDESIIRFVFVQRPNHIVSILPDQFLATVSLISIGLRIPDNIQPVTRPFLPVLLFI